MKKIGKSSNEVYTHVDFLHETTQQDIVKQTERMDRYFNRVIKVKSDQSGVSHLANV